MRRSATGFRGRVGIAAVVMVLIGVWPSVALANHGIVTAVNGSAFGYSLSVSLFGGPSNARGPAPAAALAPDASNSPQTATAPSGSAVVGPATFFSSGPLNASSQATIGAGGSATSSINIANVNTSGLEPLTAAGVASTCTASGAGGSGSATITGGTLEIDNGLDVNGNGLFTDAGDHPPVTILVPSNPAPNTSFDGHTHVNGSQDNFRYVFNQQVTNPDGSLTVYAAHEILQGPTAVGDLLIAKAQCGVTFTPGAFPPANTSAPTVSGTTIESQTLTEAHGSWTNSPTGFAYQWLDCDSAGSSCSPIAGATAQSYILTASDVGHTVRVQETASNTDGPSSPASSAATGVVQAPAPVQPPPVQPPPVQPPPPPPVQPPPAPPPTASQIQALLLSEIIPTGKAARIGALLKSGGYALSFKALSAGSARVDWLLVPVGPGAKPVLVARGHSAFLTAGTKTLKVKLTAAGKRLLKHAQHLKLTAKGAFTPTGKAAVTAKKRFTLKR